MPTSNIHSSECIRQAVRQLLQDRGWELDRTAKENASGELREYIHPKTRQRLAWIDALIAQEDLEPR